MNNKYDIDGLIRYFEMAVKVMGYTNPEESSYEYHAAKMLKQLREERDNAHMDCKKWKEMSMELNDEAKNLRNALVDARWEVCNLSSNGSIDDATREMKDRGWDPNDDNVTTTQYWCDDCGDAIEKGNEFFYAELPCDIASANQGESATVCRKCNERIEADANNEDFKRNHK